METRPIMVLGWTVGQLNSLVKRVGEKNALAIIEGRVTVQSSADDGTLKLTAAGESLFDDRGFCIPSSRLQSQTTRPDENYHFVSRLENFNAEERLTRIVEGLGVSPFISASTFSERVSKIYQHISADKKTANLLAGVSLPFVIPQTTVSWVPAGIAQPTRHPRDYGLVLKKIVEKIKQSNPAFKCQEHLTYRTAVVIASRHQRLLEVMHRGCAFGVYFPNCMQGFSILAAREQVRLLPKRFLLAGPMEALICRLAYPDILNQQIGAPVLDLAAVQWETEKYSLYLCAGGLGVNFDYGMRLDQPRGYSGSGLVVMG